MRVPDRNLDEVRDRGWTPEQAWAWADAQPWRVGCNYLPANAINQIEMWSAATFDPAMLDRELGWAARLGFNSLRVYLHDLVWREDGTGFKARIDAFLAIAARHGHAVLLVVFDDCWHEPQAGLQPTPRPGVHNSGWARSPGAAKLADRASWGELEAYVRDLAATFAKDLRVLGWDVYNEVTNTIMPTLSAPVAERAAAQAKLQQTKPEEDAAALELMTLAFGWLRSEGVTQPLTAGAYSRDEALNAKLAALSDIISFHHYRDPGSLERRIERLKTQGRPLWCTEYLNRREGCHLATHLPVFQREKIACWNWGLVDGKSQTKFAWSDPPGSSEPKVWFHDILRADGAPYDPEEAEMIRRLVSRGSPVRQC